MPLATITSSSSFGQRRLLFGCSPAALALSAFASALTCDFSRLASALACLTDLAAFFAVLLFAASLRACLAALARSLRVCFAVFDSLRRARREDLTTS